MKLVNLLLLLFLITSCGHNTKENKNPFSSYEIHGLDTVNLTDGNGFKQGHWVVCKYVVPGGKLPNESSESLKKRVINVKTEEGYYIDNKKQGIWKYYSSLGALKDSVQYKDDIAL